MTSRGPLTRYADHYLFAEMREALRADLSRQLGKDVTLMPRADVDFIPPSHSKPDIPRPVRKQL